MRRDPPRSDPVANQTCQGKKRNVNAVRRHNGSSLGPTTASNLRGVNNMFCMDCWQGWLALVCHLHGVLFAWCVTCCMVCYLHGVLFAWFDCSIWTHCHLHGGTMLV